MVRNNIEPYFAVTLQLHLNIIQSNAQAPLVSFGSVETESDKHERIICKFLMIVAIKNLKAIIAM